MILFFYFCQLIFAQETTIVPNIDIEYEKPNWTIATPTGENGETYYYPSYYIDLSPCPCDLTPRQCDSFCCCDSTCDELAKQTVFANCTLLPNTTIESMPRGILDQFSNHLQIFLRLQSETTPILGYFYTVQENVRTAAAYAELSSKATIPNELTFANQDFSQWDTLISAYTSDKYGGTVVSGGTYQALPSPSLLDDRSCTFRSPLRFLYDTNSTCIKTITSEACTSDPTLNAVYYLHSDGNVLLSSSTELPFGNESMPSFFADVPNVLPSDGSVKVYFCKNFTTNSWDVSKRNECQIRDGDVQSPSLNNITKICSDVVAAVAQKFHWTGHVTMNTTEIFLVDVHLDTELIQFFSVSWIHNPSDTLSANSTSLSTTRTWSGYVWDEVVYGTNNAFNETVSHASTSAPSDVKPVPILTTNGPENVCSFPYKESGVPVAPVRFGPNIESGCYINLSKSQFEDCSQLRQDIADTWRLLYDGIDFLSKYAYDSIPRSQNEDIPFQVDQVVQVLRANFSNFGKSAGSTTPPADAVPDNLNGENLTRIFLDEYQNILKKGPTAKTNYQFLNSRDQALSLLPFSCTRIPFSARLDIMYAETALVNGSYLNVLVGALLSLQHTTWRFSSRLNSNQLFLLKQSVRFIKVPPTEPEPVKRYYLLERRDHCPSAITCWDELFYPFLEWFPVEMYPYTKGAGLATIIAISSLYLVSKPWW